MAGRVNTVLSAKTPTTVCIIARLAWTGNSFHGSLFQNSKGVEGSYTPLKLRDCNTDSQVNTVLSAKTPTTAYKAHQAWTGNTLHFKMQNSSNSFHKRRGRAAYLFERFRLSL